MTEPAKGMIRWWDTRVMDYSGDREWAYDPPYSKEWGSNGPEMAAWRANHKVVYPEGVDKPYADEFTATMQLHGFYRGRSAAGFTFKDETGREHTMRIKCATDLLKNATLVRGKVTAVWCYAKQGRNFSLKYVRDA